MLSIISFGLISFSITLFTFMLVEGTAQTIFRPKFNFTQKPEFLSINHTLFIRGIAAFLVVFSHIGYPNLNRLWSFWGGVAVCLFLIVSGYGVNESYKINGLDKFFLRRFVLTLIPYWIITILLNIFYFKTFRFVDFVKQMLVFDPHQYWFIKYLLFEYLVYYFLRRIFKNKREQLYFFLIINVLILCFYPRMTWASQSISFFTGYLLSERNCLKSMIKNRSGVVLSTLTFIVATSFLALKQTPYLRESWYFIINFNQMLIYIFYSLSIISTSFILLNFKVRRLFYFSGKYSLNIYLVGWVFVKMFLKQHPITISSLIKYFLFTVAFIILLTLISNFFTKQIRNTFFY